MWTCGAFAGDELEVEAHGGEGKQEVGEDDGGVDTEALGGGDGDFGGDVGRAADVEEGVVLADGHVLRHVAAGLAEEPDGRAVDGLAEAGAHEAAAALGMQAGVLVDLWAELLIRSRWIKLPPSSLASGAAPTESSRAIGGGFHWILCSKRPCGQGRWLCRAGDAWPAE